MDCMQRTRILLLGHRRDLASFTELIVDQFPDLTCDFRRRVSDASDVLRAAFLRLIVFYWKTDEDREDFDRLVDELQRRQEKTPILVIIDRDSPAIMLHAFQRGAVDCLCRPVNANRLGFLVGALTSRQDHLPPAPSSRLIAEEGAGALQSESMRELTDSLRLASRSGATILLTGETGTGKNYLAAVAHRNSPRRELPLVTVDCGASSENLIESDLFGHVRGAFTGADRDHIGKLERAGGGTVLLDEINSLPMTCQARLLRALEERVFEKLGGEKTQEFAGRVIALTNKPLEVEVAERRFREDLFYRLNVITFTVPPLRERTEDIPGLVRQFLERLIPQHGSPITHVSHEALTALTDYAWPGNLRELRNVLERAVALSDSPVIEPRHLNLPATAVCVPSGYVEPAGPRLTQVRHQAERHELRRVLKEVENNRTRAARHLGISRSALYKRLDKLGIT